eukprot:30146-Pelagococcus_subviridis.AAC.3
MGTSVQKYERALVQRVHRVDAHLREELLLAAHELRRQRRHRALLEQLGLLLRRRALDGDADLSHFIHRHARGGAEPLDDVLRVHAVLDERLRLAEELSGEDDDRGRAVAHLRSRGERA